MSAFRCCKGTKKLSIMQHNYQPPVVIQMTEARLQEHLLHASQLGAHIALRAAGLPVREYYTRSELYRRHGKDRVSQLIHDGKLTPHQYPKADCYGKAHTVYSETELLSLMV